MECKRRADARSRTGLRLRWGLSSALFALALAGPGCGGGGAPPPDIVLIVVDTLRADHVGSYGYARPTTPSLDAFAARATRFERAYATAPWTQPSVASILTGLEPGRHGLRTFGRLSEEVVTVAEQLGAHGYETAAVVSHVLLARRFGFDQGFATFRVSSALPAHERESTRGVTRNAIELLEAFAAAPPPRKPFFLLVHYFDPHYRYRAHEDADFAAPSAGRISGGEEIALLRELARDGRSEEIDFVVDLYDEEIRHTDAGVGRVLATLDALDLSKNTLVVVTADHGEELMERGWLGHTRTLYEELVRVPLIVRPPGDGSGGGVIEEPVSLASLAATFLDFAGAPDDGAASLRAPSLRPLLAGEPGPPGPAGSVLVEVDFVADPDPRGGASKNAHKKAIVVGDEKLIRDDVSGRVELYDLGADPLERNDLAGQRPDRVAGLVHLLEERLAAPGRGPADSSSLQPTEQEREQLEALGYLEPGAGP